MFQRIVMVWHLLRDAARSTVRNAAAAMLVVLGLSNMATATEPAFELLPTGVDLVEIIPIVTTGMGAIILVVLASKFAFLLLRKGIGWLYKAFG